MCSVLSCGMQICPRQSPRRHVTKSAFDSNSLSIFPALVTVVHHDGGLSSGSTTVLSSHRTEWENDRSQVFFLIANFSSPLWYCNSSVQQGQQMMCGETACLCLFLLQPQAHVVKRSISMMFNTKSLAPDTLFFLRNISRHRFHPCHGACCAISHSQKQRVHQQWNITWIMSTTSTHVIVNDKCLGHF